MLGGGGIGLPRANHKIATGQEDRGRFKSEPIRTMLVARDRRVIQFERARWFGRIEGLDDGRIVCLDRTENGRPTATLRFGDGRIDRGERMKQSPEPAGGARREIR